MRSVAYGPHPRTIRAPGVADPVFSGHLVARASRHLLEPRESTEAFGHTVRRAAIDSSLQLSRMAYDCGAARNPRLRGAYPIGTTGPNRTDRLKHESPLARGGFRIAGAGFEPATFGL